MTTTPTLRDAAQAVLDALDECRFDIAANEALRAALAANPVEFDGIEALAAPADATSLAHEIWAVAQLTPGEGVEDGVTRIAALLPGAPADALAEPVEWQHRMGPTDSWQECTKEFHDWVLRTPQEWPGSEVRALVPATQLQQAEARARKEEQEIMHGLLRPVVVEAIRGMRGAPDIEENGKSLVTEIEDVFRAAIRAKGQQ